MELDEQRKTKIGEGVKYTKVGNTAYCFFDEFICDDSGWRLFYKSEGPKPTIEDYPNDWLIILIDALEKAQKDPEVKNFILDISTNNGGSSDIVLFVTSMFANKSDMYSENTLTRQKTKSTFEVDRNLDGKFDEKDKDFELDLNIGVLISPSRLLMWQHAASTPKRLRHLPARHEVWRWLLRRSLWPLCRWFRLSLLLSPQSPQQCER